ncbi:MAG: hypothetical protein PQJ46_00290 [Spirochaetales bacterium]|nr:hypothetical protein [Spirochaetales bacterium]
MRKIYIPFIVLYAFFFLGCSGQRAESNTNDTHLQLDSYGRGSYSIALEYPTGNIEYGSSFDIILRITYPSGTKYILLPPDTDSSEKYSNTVINSTDEKAAVSTDDGKLMSEIIFNIEAWLPGEVVFPSLKVQFPDEIDTDEISVNVVSAFDSSETELKLAPLYIPKESGNRKIILIIALSVLFLLVIVGVIVFIVKHRKKKYSEKIKVPTKAELVEDFRNKYIDNSEPFELKDAFSALSKIMPVIPDEKIRKLSERARFSRNGISDEEGRQALYSMYQKVIKELNEAEENEL